MVSSEGSQRTERLTRDKVCRVEGGRVQEEDRVGRIILMYHCEIVAVVIVSSSPLWFLSWYSRQQPPQQTIESRQRRLWQLALPSFRVLSISSLFVHFSNVFKVMSSTTSSLPPAPSAYIPPSAAPPFLRRLIVSALSSRGFDAAEAGALTEIERLVECRGFILLPLGRVTTMRRTITDHIDG